MMKPSSIRSSNVREEITHRAVSGQPSRRKPGRISCAVLRDFDPQERLREDAINTNNLMEPEKLADSLEFLAEPRSLRSSVSRFCPAVLKVDPCMRPSLRSMHYGNYYWHNKLTSTLSFASGIGSSSSNSSPARRPRALISPTAISSAGSSPAPTPRPGWIKIDTQDGTVVSPLHHPHFERSIATGSARSPCDTLPHREDRMKRQRRTRQRELRLACRDSRPLIEAMTRSFPVRSTRARTSSTAFRSTAPMSSPGQARSHGPAQRDSVYERAWSKWYDSRPRLVISNCYKNAYALCGTAREPPLTMTHLWNSAKTSREDTLEDQRMVMGRIRGSIIRCGGAGTAGEGRRRERRRKRMKQCTERVEGKPIRIVLRDPLTEKDLKNIKCILNF